MNDEMREDKKVTAAELPQSVLKTTAVSVPNEAKVTPASKEDDAAANEDMGIDKDGTAVGGDNSRVNENTVTIVGVADDQLEGAITKTFASSTGASGDIAGDWIDRTNEPLGEIGNGYTLTPTLTSLYLTNNRIKEMKNLEQCRSLRELVLSQNVITVLEGIDSLEGLVELDLYMNQIEEIPLTTFKANPNLKKLDLSFNKLRSLETFPSGNLANLEELYLSGNKIKTISAMRDMPKLVMLELGDNRIRDLENLEDMTTLEGLWLGRNKITRIQNLEPLVNLRRLSLQSNRLEAIEGVSHLQHLEELYLSHNGIKSMCGVEALTNLRVLDLGVNFIEHIEEVEKLIHLQEFWINGNKLQAFEELQLLRNASKLETVYLEGNPLAEDTEYRRKVLELLPNSLEQLDALLVEDVRRALSLQEQIAEQNAPTANFAAEALEDTQT